MSKTVAIDHVVYCTTDRDGAIWASVGREEPRPSGMDADRFAVAMEPGTRLRVLGDRRNARLIMRLHLRNLATPHDEDELHLEVGRPPELDWRQFEDLPSGVVRRMQRVEAVRSSVGGWHRLTDEESVTYVMMAVAAASDCNEAAVTKFVRLHPAYPAVSFVQGLDETALGQLLVEIGDPRWFVDPEHPDRASRLRSFVGLSGGRSSRVRDARRRLVLQAWKGQETPADITKPGHFLWRARESRAEPIIGDLHASRRFLAFLAWTWVDAIATPRIRPEIPGENGLFVPDLFFDAIDAAAFRTHLKAAHAKRNAEIHSAESSDASD